MAFFGNNKKDNKSKPTTAKSSAPQSTGGLNSLVHQTKLEGTINADSDFRVDGRIKGTLNCKARVIIGPTGAVDGQIHCQNAIIEGYFSGDLKVSDSLIIKGSATVSGDIETASLTVEPGAKFNVVCKTKGTSNTLESEVKGK